MRMMMLHFHPEKRLFTCPFCRKVFRVFVTRQKRWSKAKKTLIVLKGLKPSVVGERVFHVAYVLRDERFIATQKAGGCFLLGASSTHAYIAWRLKRFIYLKWRWRISASTAHELQRRTRLLEVKYAHHRIVVARTNFAIVAQQSIGNGPQRL